MKVLLIYLALIPVVYSAVYTPGTPGASWSEEEAKIIRRYLWQILEEPEFVLALIGPGPVVPLGKSMNGSEMLAYYQQFEDSEEEFSLTDGLLPNAAKFCRILILKRTASSVEVKKLHANAKQMLHTTNMLHVTNVMRNITNVTCWTVAPKMIRLAFHDCLIDSETGGCNGCLNFNGMGEENVPDCFDDGKCKYTNPPKETNNNNLLWVARVLEILYTQQQPHEDMPSLPNGSLKDTGKSRADLWAFAGLVAIEYTAENHNDNCDPNQPSPCAQQIDENSPPCNYELPPFNFKTGRKDCIPGGSQCGPNSVYPFCSAASEVHPDPHGNGPMTVEFFEENFGFNARETVAIMGAHTLGHPNERISGFRHYPWTRGDWILNNRYYQVMAWENNYLRPFQTEGGNPLITGQNIEYGQCNLTTSSFAGDEEGNALPFYWKVKSEFRTNSGGNWNWEPFAQLCNPQKCDDPSVQPWRKTSCCRNIGGGMNGFCAQNPNLEECEFMCSPPGVNLTDAPCGEAEFAMMRF